MKMSRVRFLLPAPSFTAALVLVVAHNVANVKGPVRARYAAPNLGWLQQPNHTFDS